MSTETTSPSPSDHPARGFSWNRSGETSFQPPKKRSFP